jgi:wobble nucleotide-excising tRNase
MLEAELFRVGAAAADNPHVAAHRFIGGSMINGLRLLRNVGQFDSIAAAAHVFKKLTLVYAENGRGKTTLSALLRCLATNRPDLILERQRLAAVHPPEVIIDCTGGPPPAMFQNGAWNRHVPTLAIFDDSFVDENVCSGLSVEAEHRHNLHELILGAQGVTLNQQQQGLVARIEAHNAELRTKASAVPAASMGGMAIEAFCALQARPTIDADIQEAERALDAAREQTPIREARLFEAIALPSFDTAAIGRLLARDLPGLDTVAARRVQEHLARLPTGSESWVADGMRRLSEDARECPFCAQDLKNSPVLLHYRAFFSQEYSTLKESISRLAANISQEHSDNGPVVFERALRTATERRAFWARFADMPQIAFDSIALAQDWQRARQLVAAVLAAKAAAPLDRMTLSQETRDAIAAYDQHRARAAALSSQLVAANRTINLVKEQAAAGNVAAREADLVRLRAIKARHEPNIATLCDAYLAEKAAKTATEQQRDQAREALEQYRRNVFPNYQNAINQYLGRFNAGFRLEQIQPTNTRGGSACSYSLSINNVVVPVMADSGPGQHAFRNTLSSGDRNTLALAFFFACLDQDPCLANKVIVIDDPVSSLDDNRSLTTVQEIRRLLPRVDQVIILSHSKPFLCQTWESSDPTQRAALQVRRDGQTSSTIDAWNVDADLVTEYDRRHEKLRTYLLTGGVGNLSEIAVDIRPTLEYFCRVAYTADYPPGALLGNFRDRCQTRLSQGTPIMSAADLQELRDLTDYGNRFHHDSNPQGYLTVVVTDAELQGFVQRTLAFCSRR